LIKERFPLIVDIKRGSLEDGPGTRTTVFFKGCPLSCKWCHNPEAMDPQSEIGFYPRNCIGCFDCERACPEGAILKEPQERIDRTRCTRCGRCTEACPSKALREIGRFYDGEELLEYLLRDRVFYEISGGGVTLSGGEPALWPEYAGSLLNALKLQGVHAAMQTSGYFDYPAFEYCMLPYLDLIMYDLKLINDQEHHRHTGRSNKKILENFSRLVEEPIEILPRIPLIPEVTASKENLEGIFEFLKGKGVKACDLLPYNSMGLSKLHHLGKAADQFLAGSEGLKGWRLTPPVRQEL
jgi:pyruvate formate lyase activating enzyme